MSLRTRHKSTFVLGDKVWQMSFKSISEHFENNLICDIAKAYGLKVGNFVRVITFRNKDNMCIINFIKEFTMIQKL